MMDAADTNLAARAAELTARASYGRLVAILSSRDRNIAAAEDALSEALVAALSTWPRVGVPHNPDAWLLTAARNRQRNTLRAAKIRDDAQAEIERRLALSDDVSSVPDRRLQLMFLCAHPAIDSGARTPLMLQVVLGIDAARIAKAFLVEPSAMSQRLVRAKARIQSAGLRFELPEREDMTARLAAVLEAIYAAYGQGWNDHDAARSADGLTMEAIWLARLIVTLLPDEPEPKGLLALMLYCEARLQTRRGPDGAFVPLAQQDARLWDRTMIIQAEGLLTTAAQSARFGRFQCEAAIQSVHAQRAITGRLNHDALLVLYDLLVRHTNGIGARIGRAVVIADAGDAGAALAALDELPSERIFGHQPWWVARSHVLALLGRLKEADSALNTAIRLTDDPAIRAHLGALRRVRI
jgi:RNA polymerase sigma-70 factor, ECF subfamily